jgi:hypothetical protein
MLLWITVIKEKKNVSKGGRPSVQISPLDSTMWVGVLGLLLLSEMVLTAKVSLTMLTDPKAESVDGS